MTMPIPADVASSMLFWRYQNNQDIIATRVSMSIASLWSAMVDPEHFSDSWVRLQPIVAGIVDTHHSMSASDAADYMG